MLCYKDMTFCTNEDCANVECYSHLNESIKTRSKKFGLPLSLSYFDCKYSVYYSEEEAKFVGICNNFPNLKYFADIRSKALEGIKQLIEDQPNATL
jgi:hypothetical protein